MADFRRFFKLFGMPEDGSLVPRRGLEPPRPCERQHLKLVRLPIPPSGHGGRERELGGASSLVNARRIGKGHGHDRQDRPADHPVRRRRLYRPLCRPGPVQGRRPRPHRRARPAPRLFPEAARAGSARSSSPAPTSPMPGAVAAAVAGRRRGRQPGRHPQGRFPQGPCRRAPATSPRPRPRPACRLWSTSRRSAPIPRRRAPMAAPRARARRRSAPPSRPPPSCAPRSRSGRRTISSTASPAWRGCCRCCR